MPSLCMRLVTPLGVHWRLPPCTPAPPLSASLCMGCRPQKSRRTPPDLPGPAVAGGVRTPGMCCERFCGGTLGG